MSRWTGVDRVTVTALVVTAVVGAVAVSLLARGRSIEVAYDLFVFHNGPSAVILAWLSRLVLGRHPGNGAGRILLVVAVLSAVHTVVAALADARLVAAGRIEPMSTFADGERMADLSLDSAVLVFTMNWLWVPLPVLLVTILPLVFPDGDLPSRRWWPVPVLATVGALMMMIGLAIDAWPTSTWTAEEAPAFAGVLLAAGLLGVLTAAVGALTAFGMRWWQADVGHRRPFRVVGATVGVLALVLVATYPWQDVWVPAILASFYVMLSAYGLAVARYRLHDIEPFLGRAAVATLLSAVIAAIYATIVIGAGSLVGRPFDSALLPVVALAAIVLVIEPARRWARGLVDRWLFHTETDRTEVLSRLAARASTSATGADVLGEVTELLVRSSGALRAEVWLDTAPAAASAAASSVPGATTPTAPVLTVEITHQGQRFGELRLFAPARADLVGDAPALVADVAHAVGVVLRNEELAVQMRAQLDELQASRRRLVEAHDRGRRSLERDLHDGAQSRLIALRLRLGVARVRFGENDKSLAGELEGLAGDIDAAVGVLRDLARGLASPVLEQSGLAAALRAQARTMPIPVAVTTTTDGADSPDPAVRYPQAVEHAGYLCCLEAIQNAMRHSGATSVRVEIAGDERTMRFEVCDDGCGFEPAAVVPGTGLSNIDDRVSALGGRVQVESAPGAGTRISAEIPAQGLRG